MQALRPSLFVFMLGAFANRAATAQAGSPLPNYFKAGTFFQGVSLSPNGKQIAITAKVGTRWDIYTIDVDGTGFRKLTTDSTPSLWASWMPDGGRLVYSGRGPANDKVLRTVRADGSDNKVLTTPVVGYPEVGPDGAAILGNDGANGKTLIVRVDVAGSQKQVLSDWAESAENGRWSPDGKHIAAQMRTSKARDQLFVMNSDGTHSVRLSTDSAGEGWPVWISNTEVGFTHGEDLYGIQIDGTQQHLIRGGVLYAAFARDGSRMAFIGHDDNATHIYVAKADGTNARRLPMPIDP